MSNETPRKQGIGSLGYAVLAVLCAGFAAFLLATVLKAKGYKQEKRAEVLVAVRSIPAGSALAKQDVKVVQVAEKLVPLDAVTNVDALFPKDEDPPLAATGIIQGEFILKGRLADPRKGTAMAGLVREGYRGFPVTVDKAIARSRLVFPGAKVDVVGTFRESQLSISRLLVENVRVLSLESQVDVETSRAADTTDQENSAERRINDTVVTIEVTPAEAELVALASREGKVDLVLRNPNDETPTLTAGITTLHVMSPKFNEEMAAAMEDAEPPEAQADPSRSVRNRRGRASRPPRATPLPERLQDGKAATGAAAGGIEVISVKGNRR